MESAWMISLVHSETHLSCVSFNAGFAAIFALQSAFDKQLLWIHHKHSSFCIKGTILGFDSLSLRSPQVRGSLPKHSHLSIRTHLCNTAQRGLKDPGLGLGILE